MVVGIDEAGRGPVLGPMVVAAVQVEEKQLPMIEDVKESKQLPPAVRWRVLAEKWQYVNRAALAIIYPSSIDAYTRKKQLNHLEYKVFCLLANMFADKVIADFPENLGQQGHILFEQGADAKYPVVALASILAKVVRDYLIHLYHYAYGDFGSGYPTDPKTRQFLDQLLDLDLPIIRKSWKTVKRLKKSKRLEDFL
ncbi:MAG: ribonuclease HII [bacterium]|nr:ribonuclease HII [bacterium]